MGADNQQERLVTLGWVLGFVDGEGCFSLGLVRQNRRENRIGYRTGFQVFHEFVGSQGAKSVDVLYSLRDFFGVGMVAANRRNDNHREAMHRYLVRRRDHLLEIVIPFFREYPLRTAKQRDFEIFAQCIEMMQNGEHLEVRGLERIVELIGTMNRQKPRTDVIKILRDHTPEA